VKTRCVISGMINIVRSKGSEVLRKKGKKGEKNYVTKFRFAWSLS